MAMNFEEYFREALGRRATGAGNSIAAGNQDYRTLSRTISVIEVKFRESECHAVGSLLDEYIEVLLKRDALIQEQIYRQGFEDGISFGNVLKNGGTKHG